MEPIRGEADLDRLRRAAAAWSTLCAWMQGGQLALLADGEPRRLDELPGDPRALEVTAPILGHLGLLVRAVGPEGEVWRLSQTGAQLLAAGALTPGAAPIEDLGKVPLVLREGGPAPGPDGTRRPHVGGTQPHDPAATRRFLDMLYRRSAGTAEDTAALIARRLGRGGAALDLGGGHGRYGAALRAHGFEVTLLDQAPVVEIARERHGELLRYQAGNFDQDDFGAALAGGSYDVVLLSNIVHGLGPGSVRRLLRGLREVVRPGGLLVIKDMFIDASGVGPEPGVMFGLTMLIYTAEGRSYGLDELRGWLLEAGFGSLEQVVVTDQGYTLLIAR